MSLMYSQIANQYMKQVSEFEFRTNCPFCPDTKQHLYFNIDLGVYHCFKCGAQGKLYLDDEIPYIPKKQKSELTLINAEPIHIKYLYNRGLTLEDIFLYKPVAYTKYPLYVFSSLSNIHVGRNIENKEPKYIKINDSFTPYGIEVLPKKFDTLVLVEGVFDFIAVTNYAKLPCVALLGKSLPNVYKNYIISLPIKKVIVLLDADALESADKIYKELRLWKQVEIIKPKDDPWNDRFILPELGLHSYNNEEEINGYIAK